jgi:uncharacterized membrane protein YozB (DUF420 family)
MNNSLEWSIFILALVHVLVSFVMVLLPIGGEKTKRTTFVSKLKEYNVVVWFVSFLVVAVIAILSAIDIKNKEDECA